MGDKMDIVYWALNELTGKWVKLHPLIPNKYLRLSRSKKFRIRKKYLKKIYETGVPF